MKPKISYTEWLCCTLLPIYLKTIYQTQKLIQSKCGNLLFKIIRGTEYVVFVLLEKRCCAICCATKKQKISKT